MTEDGARSFATSGDLAAYWHALTDAETRQAETLIRYVSMAIRRLSPIWQDLQQDEPDALTLAVVTTVKSMMSNPDRDGISQATQTVGSFSESLSYANPDGSIYFPKFVRQLLGIDAQQIGSTRPVNSEAGTTPETGSRDVLNLASGVAS